ncbi:hypothetical protein NPIL_573011 [Nephila pilipes]|uniref:Uncharacterized protein n=1 Tax=Nephila pilipes TaxID=299642 RepID=A0A8X6TEG5_NEPPI|nr:hypothetical protein NPIL_573011 [Nephila pilipes]
MRTLGVVKGVLLPLTSRRFSRHVESMRACLAMRSFPRFLLLLWLLMVPAVLAARQDTKRKKTTIKTTTTTTTTARPVHLSRGSTSNKLPSPGEIHPGKGA